MLLIGCEGTLHIKQNEVEYALGPDQCLLLFPGIEHYGSSVSVGNLSYYWCHFVLLDEYEILNEPALNAQLLSAGAQISAGTYHRYLLPEYADIPSGDRTSVLFRHLIDLSRQNVYSNQLMNYSLSILAMEIAQGFVSVRLLSAAPKSHFTMMEIKEYIRINYEQNLTVKHIADKFNYNANYISMIFKRYTGLPLLRFINQTRIAASKELLLNSSDPVKQIAQRVGFQDEKHYMKIFKKSEGVTSSKYRNSFFRKHITKK